MPERYKTLYVYICHTQSLSYKYLFPVQLIFNCGNRQVSKGQKQLFSIMYCQFLMCVYFDLPDTSAMGCLLIGTCQCFAYKSWAIVQRSNPNLGHRQKGLIFYLRNVANYMKWIWFRQGLWNCSSNLVCLYGMDTSAELQS